MGKMIKIVYCGMLVQLVVTFLYITRLIINPINVNNTDRLVRFYSVFKFNLFFWLISF